MQERPYYLNHFFHLLESVERRYGGFLSPAEKAYIAKLQLLPQEALCLYVRIANRKGPYFRLAKLLYPEALPIESSIKHLLDNEFLREFSNHSSSSCEAIWHCFSLRELQGFFGAPIDKNIKTKAQYCQWIQNLSPSLLVRFFTQNRLLAIHQQDPWNFLKFLFFGELTDNLSGFVVHELGYIVTDKPEAEKLCSQFTTREEAEVCFRIANLYEEFRDRRETQDSMSLYQWWQDQKITHPNLPQSAKAVHNRLIERLGKMLEREQQHDLAISLYCQSPLPPCRERHIRLLMKRNRQAEAMALCHLVLQNSVNTEEAYNVQQLLNKLLGKKRCTEARSRMKEGLELPLPLPAEGLHVEASVLNHFQTQGWEGVHSENWLWNALFGLLLWDIIYDASYGAFHHPLQFAPADLNQPEFYKKRADAIEERLRLLDNKAKCIERLAVIYEAKKGILNPFVSWHENIIPLLRELVMRVPSEALGELIRYLAQDIQHRRRGFPDLFLWRKDDEKEYLFAEVKSENDQLQPHQYVWLRFLERININVQIIRPVFETVPEKRSA